eukprot:scaffold8949_cov126-Skeletonema_marinoi.AAC.14
MKLLSPVLLLVATAAPAHSIPHLSEIIESIQEQREEPQPHLQLEEEFSKSDVQTLTFDQRLDHFSSQIDCHQDNNECETFKQRYFYTSRYVRKEEEKKGVGTTVSFLCVGGEGPSLDPSVLVDSVHCTGDMIELAHKLHHEQNWDVHMFALEHRYYGQSFPKKNNSKKQGDKYLRANEKELDSDNEYKYLSSRQAVRDIVEFINSSESSQHFSSSNNKNVRWITFGGSYPGMLSGWSRLLHPDVVYGAVANSAPVQAEADFRKYNDHVSLDLGEESLVGGSKKCLDIFESGHAEVAAILEGGDVDEIKKVASAFDVCDGATMLLKNRKNLDFFVGYPIMFPIEVQSNDPSCDEPLCNIQKICDSIVDEHKSDPHKPSMEILASIGKQAGRCKQVNFQLLIDYFSAPSTAKSANNRSWYYQTCTEFGFYQTCEDNSNCPYARGHHNVDMDFEICEKSFGIDAKKVKASIESTREYYGGWDLIPGDDKSTVLEGQKRLLFVNGNADPWSELSVNEKRGSSHVQTINVPGASHHFWTHPVKESDDNHVVEARKAIYRHVYDWLGINEDSPRHYDLKTE